MGAWRQNGWGVASGLDVAGPGQRTAAKSGDP